MLGLTSQEIFIKLSDDTSKLEWNIDGTWATSSSYGQIDLVNKVKNIKLSTNENSLIINDYNNNILMEIKAENEQIRDEWIIILNELLTLWNDKPELKPKCIIDINKESNKNNYFKNKEIEISEREKRNNERKAKLLGQNGMKYTAQVMANRA